MNLSGIAVSVRPQLFDETVDLLDALPGVETHYKDLESVRVVVVQEADSVDAEVEGLKRITAIPGVVVAELVYHYFADDPGMNNQSPPDLASISSISSFFTRRNMPRGTIRFQSGYC